MRSPWMDPLPSLQECCTFFDVPYRKFSSLHLKKFLFLLQSRLAWAAWPLLPPWCNSNIMPQLGWSQHANVLLHEAAPCLADKPPIQPFLKLHSKTIPLLSPGCGTCPYTLDAWSRTKATSSFHSILCGILSLLAICRWSLVCLQEFSSSKQYQRKNNKRNKRALL